MLLSSRKYMSKRQRPCDFCRSRKTACRIEGGLPCRLCTLHGRQCTFVEAARRRKQMPASTSGDIPVQNDNPIADVATYQDGLGQESITSPHSDSMDGTTPPNEVRSWQENDTGRHEEPNTDGAPTGFSDWTNDVLERLDTRDSTSWFDAPSTGVPLDVNDGLHPQVLGHSGDMDPYLLQSYQYDHFDIFQFKQLSIHSVSQSTIPTQFLLSRPELFASSRQEMGHDKISFETLGKQLEELVSHDTSLRLVALFRRFILPQYPILSESQFLTFESRPPHLLAAIYIIAQPFAKFDDVLSVELAYENINNEALFRIVQEALRYETHDPKIATVQTLLLIIIRPSTSPLVLGSSLKWALHGTLIATSQTLGLHHDPASWNIPPSQIAFRRRLSSTIFTTDKWLAASLGRPPLITQDSWLVTSLSIADGHGSFLTSALWLAHLQYNKLGSLVGDVLYKLFSPRAMHELASDIEKTVSASKCLLDELSDWHQGFTAQSSENATEDGPLPTICTLGYHYLQMTISRAVMRPFIANVNDNAATMNHPDPARRIALLSFAQTGVRSSTTAATTFVKNLHQYHLHMFWPHWSQVAFSCICFLDLLMAISSLNYQEALAWFQELHTARREIRLKSAMLPVLQLGLLRIDAVFWKGIDKVLHLLPHVQEALAASLKSDKG